MIKEKKCYYVNEDRDGKITNFNNGITWLLDNSKRYGGWIATLTIRDMESIADYPGMEALAQLIKNNPHRARISGVDLELIIELRIPSNGKSRPLLAIHPTKKFLDKLHAIQNVPKMMVVPRDINEINEWKEYSNAIAYGSTRSNKSTNEINRVILNALRNMTQIMNLANEMVHPRNQDIVVETLQILQKNGEKFTKEDVKKYLIKYLDWDPILAGEASNLVLKIKTGKRHRFITGQHWREDTINEWRKET